MYTFFKKKISKKSSIFLINNGRFSFVFNPLIKLFFKRKRCFMGQQDIIGYVTYKNIKSRFFLNHESYIENKILNDGIHSLFILDEIVTNIKPNSIFIDVGANIGSISIPVANLMSKDGVEVVSCEASQVMCERFRNNVTLNIIENILINESAIFSHDNGITFYEQKLTNNNMGLSSSRKNFDIGEFVERKVDSISIDSLYESLNTSKSISVIKIDVQGGEIDVLLGASEVIKNHKPVFIFEHEDEYHDNAMSVKNKIKSIFDRNGYDLYVLDSNLDGVLVPIDLSVYVNTNIVALPN
jgi:FkbM family methyltransferase